MSTTAGPTAQNEPLRTPSLRRRATVMVVALMAIMLIVLVVATSVALRERLDDQLRQRLVERAGVADALVGEVDSRDLARRLEGQGVSVVVTTADGQQYAEGSLAGRAGAAPDTSTDPGPSEGPQAPEGGPAPPAPGPADPPGAEPAVRQSGDLLSVSRTLDDGSTLLLLADASEVSDTVSQVRWTLVVAALGVLLLTALAVPLVVRGALRPLGTITEVAGSITRGDRGRRLRPSRPGTDLGRTASAFDEMLDEVVGAEARAVDSEARLRGFLSDAAHELRTPVSGIAAAAEYLLREDPDRAEREESLVALIRESRRAGRLVDDLLLMARIDRGLELSREPVDLAELVDGVLSVRGHLWPEASVVVEGEAPTVTADRDRVHQVVANLVDNALQATHGTGHVSVRLGHGPGRGSGDVLLEVLDDGPGVPAADRERVFDRLVRLDDRPGSKGSGLGLSIARGIARAHGGDLVCVPTDSGARFRLTLPA